MGPGLCDGFVAITDAEAVRVARSLASEEGVLSGSAAGRTWRRRCGSRVDEDIPRRV